MSFGQPVRSDASALAPRGPSDIVGDIQIARIEVALWADPDLVTNAAATVRTTMNYCPVADEYAIPDPECLRLTHADIRAEHQAVATMPHEGRKQLRRNMTTR